jgi:hypothetical protein
VSLVASTGPSRGRSQRSLLVSVGTTFRTDNLFLDFFKDNVILFWPQQFKELSIANKQQHHNTYVVPFTPHDLHCNT